VRITLADPPSYTLPYDSSLAAALANRGHDIELLAAHFPFGEPPRAEGYERREISSAAAARILRRAPRSRIRLAVKAADYAPTVARLLRRVGAFDPAVVHVQWLALPQVDRMWLRRLAARRPVVFTAHDVLPSRTKDDISLWRGIFATVDRVVVHGAGAVERLAEIGVPRGRITRIPHPLFEAAGEEPSAPNGNTLLHFGLLRWSKGLDVLLRALPAIAEQVPDVRLVVAGDPLEPVEPLQRLAEEEGVAARVEWRLGFVGESEIPPLMATATAVVLPYRQIESSGVLATALGHGRPAVVTDVGSLGATVREFGAGRVAPPEDPAALAAACVELLADPSALAEAYAGTTRARAALSWDAAAEAHEQLYDEVCAARGSS
jgi:glycosyltransferase involved in cell wall biosynthesis